MTTRELFPMMPIQLRVDTNMKLGNRELSALDDDARFIVRTLVAQAYTQGFADGYMAGYTLDAVVDRQIERGKKEAPDDH